jgi:hypothetical protein
MSSIPRTVALILITNLFLTLAGSAEPAPAPAPTAPDVGAAFAAMRAVVEQKDAEGKYVHASDVRSNIQRYLSKAEQCWNQADYVNAENQLNSLQQVSSIPAIQDATGKLLEQVREARKAGVKVFLDRGQAILDDIKSLPTREVTETDLDKLTETLTTYQQELQRQGSSSSASLQLMNGKIERAQYVLRSWTAIVLAEASSDYGTALEQLRNLSSNTGYAQVIPASLLLKKQKNLETKAMAGFDDTLKDLRTRLAKADTAEAAQGVRDEFQALYTRYARSGGDGTLRSNLERTQQALSYWLNVLSAEEGDNLQGAMEQLSQLENGSYRDTLLIPGKMVTEKRKALLARMLKQGPGTNDPAIEVMNAEISKAASVEDLVALQSRIQQLNNMGYSSRSGAYQELQSLSQDLQILSNMKGALDARQFAQVVSMQLSHGGYGNNRWRKITDGFAQSMRLQALIAQHQLGDVPLDAKQGKLDEQLLQAADVHAQKGEWERVLRILEAYRAMFAAYGSSGWLQSELMACQSFLQAQNYERAEQYPQAVASYLQVIAQIGKRVPTQAAKERLLDLKKTHPEAFNAGAIVPPTVRGSAMAIPMNMQVVPEPIE